MHDNPHNIIVGSTEDFSSIDQDRLEILREMHMPLEQLYPDEFNRYLDLFFKYCPRRPFHVRTEYGRGFICQNGTKTTGDKYARPCYPALIAKMLDLDRWRRLNPDKKSSDYYWVATNTGKSSSTAAIDFDNKQNLLGYYKYGPHDHCPIRPLVTVTLDHLQALKRVYDEFPGRIWCISSGTLGLHVWEKFARPQPICQIHAMTKPRLAAIGLGNTEVHPMFGRVFRRPFGQDYYTVTDGGLLSDWIEQLNYFENVAEPPAFVRIYEAIRSLLLREWGSYQNCGGKMVSDTHAKHLEKYFLGKKLPSIRLLQDDLNKLDKWAEQGFPQELTVSVPVPVDVNDSAHQPAEQAGGLRSHRTRTGSKCDIDLSAVCDGQWVQNCEEWATKGLPCHDSLFLVVSQLARWFYYVELFDIENEQRRKRVISLLQHYCLNKNNGYISRLNAGLTQDVKGHVQRAVEAGIKSMDLNGKIDCSFVRQKRETGKYKRVIYLEPVLGRAVGEPGEEEGNDSLFSSVGFNICCTVLPPVKSKEDRQQRAEDWIFQPDETPLPESLQDLITAYYEGNRLACYKPTWKKITQLLNHVHGQGGEARLGVETLAKMGFMNHASRQHVQRLVDAGVLRKTKEYSTITGLGRGYRLSKKTMEMFEEKVKAKTA